MNLWEINQKERRNYHLWKYILNITKIHIKEIKSILIFCYYNFMNNTLDYSAYSTLRYLYSIAELTTFEKHILIDYSNRISSIIKTDDKYLCEFLNLLN